MSDVIGHQAGMETIDNEAEEALWEYAKRAVRPQINVLSRQLEAKLRHNAQDDWRSGQRRGQLEVNRAFRSLISDFAIFRDRQEIGDHEYAFLITVDRSGSQSQRIQQILESVVLVTESLERAGLPCAVIPWDTVPQGRKSFSEPLSSARDRLSRYVGRVGGGTYEAPALIIAQEEFRKVRGKKVLITITDGQTNNPEESAALMMELEREGVSCLAISVKCAVPRHYRHSIRIEDAAELSRILPTFIAQTIRRG
jgi:cobalamin biosynthesis protein CobT